MSKKALTPTDITHKNDFELLLNLGLNPKQVIENHLKGLSGMQLRRKRQNALMIMALIIGTDKIIGFNYVPDGKKKCSICHKIFLKDFFRKKAKSKDGLKSSCKKCDREKEQDYYRHNKDAYNNRKKLYQRKRKRKDYLFKLKHNLRTRTYLAFKNKGYNKNTKTKEMLGVEWSVAKKHIEMQFKKGMTWDNQGEWHIDHIIPLASAKDKEELKKLCHYTNLQPLWAEENISKSDKIIETQITLRI